MKLYKLLTANGDIKIIIFYSIPFLLLIIVSFLINDKILDIFTNTILAVMFIFTVESGDISASIFIIFIIYKLENIKQLIVVGSFIFLSFSISSFTHRESIMNIFMLLIGYLYVLAKYYYTIHVPTQSLHQENRTLRHQVSMIPTAPMTDAQILQKYPYMYFKQTDPKKDPDPYRKIKDLHLLIIEEKAYKEIADINGISEQTQYREFSKLKYEFTTHLKLEKKIDTVQGLTIACMKLGIIRVDYLQ